ncbi:MAG: DNA methyltransferase [Nanoarchaeota archaeon]
MQYFFKLSGESFGLALAELEALFEIFVIKHKLKKKTSKNIVIAEIPSKREGILELCKRSAFIQKVYLNKLKIWEALKGRFLEREPMKKPAFHPTMLKPKLARLLVNLSGAKEGETILDPFCGAGSILIEAAVLGTKVIGTDFDSEMIARAKKNLEFYKKLYKNNLNSPLVPYPRTKVRGFNGTHLERRIQGMEKALHPAPSRAGFSRFFHKNLKLKVADATQLEKVFKPNSVDAIATDLPYGRSSRASLKNLEVLYKNFLTSAHTTLKNKKYLVLMYPHYINTKKQISKKQWTLISEGELYVHGGLTRKLVVLKKV